MRRKYENEEERARVMGETHTRCAKRALKVFEKNGGIYIKLGQHLAALRYLIPIVLPSPTNWTVKIIGMGHNYVCVARCMSTHTNARSRTIIAQDVGHPLNKDFSSFDLVPIGMASLAQVHRPKPAGSARDVAVKIQHPELARYSAIDIDTARM